MDHDESSPLPDRLKNEYKKIFAEEPFPLDVLYRYLRGELSDEANKVVAAYLEMSEQGRSDLEEVTRILQHDLEFEKALSQGKAQLKELPPRLREAMRLTVEQRRVEDPVPDQSDLHVFHNGSEVSSRCYETLMPHTYFRIGHIQEAGIYTVRVGDHKVDVFCSDEDVARESSAYRPRQAAASDEASTGDDSKKFIGEDGKIVARLYSGFRRSDGTTVSAYIEVELFD